MILASMILQDADAEFGNQLLEWVERSDTARDDRENSPHPWAWWKRKSQ